MLPNFIIAGAPRASTTYLVNILDQHPDIFIAKNGYTHDIHFLNPDSTHVVNQNYHKGMEWYESLFSSVNNEKAVGEKTATYFTEKATPAYIQKHLGMDVRIIVVLRNPAERANSDFWYHRGHYPDEFSIKDVFEMENDKLQIAQAGKYYENYCNYLEYFEPENFHFILFEDLRENPENMIKKVFRFLEVDENFLPSGLGEKINSAFKDESIVYRLKMAGSRIKAHHPAVFKFLNERKLFQNIRDSLHKSGTKSKKKYPELTEEEKKYLSEFYRPDIEEMSRALSNKSILEWL